jgi:hypothetical protein
MGLWTVVVMPDNVLVPPLPCPLITLTQSTLQRRKEREIARRGDVEYHTEPLAHLSDIARKSRIYSICLIQFNNK